jgi:cold shock CspA family protein
MNIEFGNITSYNPDRGFGFISRTFLNPNQKIFFHIKKIKRRYPQLAQKLDSGEPFKAISCWYEVETTQKGEQMSRLWLNVESIPQSYSPELSGLIQHVETIWKNISSPKPSWLDMVTSELIGVERKNELGIEREKLKTQLRNAEEERRKQAEHQQNKGIELLRKKYKLTQDQGDELYQLLTQMRPLQFTHSKRLSAYIVRHKLGHKYKKISGVLRMELDGEEWDFHGGFPPEIYKIICMELGLESQNTLARPRNFTSFEEFYSDI